MITDTSRIKKTTFRSLIWALLFSFAYDVIWFLSNYSEYTKQDGQSIDGGKEGAVRKFSATMSLLSLAFRVIFLL